MRPRLRGQSKIPAALALEVARRRQERQDLIALLRKLIRRSPGSLLRARDLRRMLALYLGRAPRLAVLGQAMAAIGAAYQKTLTVRGWRGVALVASPERARRHVIAAWDRRLEEEGLGVVRPIEPDLLGWRRSERPLRGGRWAEKREELAARQRIYTGVFEAARDYLWTCRWRRWPPRDRQIWERWALEGMTVRDIAEALDLRRSTVQDVLTRHKARAGILGH